jgi:Dihaem cytochrome c
VRRAFLIGWLAAAAAAGGCSSPLPEAGSDAANLYVRRCGACHQPYRPELMTPMMWETMVDRMSGEMSRQGVPLAGDEKSAILDYLKRNAGKR